MTVSVQLQDYLNRKHVPFDVLTHPHTNTSLQSARSAHITPTQMIKAVVLKRAPGDYLMCLIPASQILMMSWLKRDYGNHCELISEWELDQIFSDCASGAVPAMGQAFGMHMVLENSLQQLDTVYFEAGDHQHLVEMSGEHFQDLMRGCDWATISCCREDKELYRQLH